MTDAAVAKTGDVNRRLEAGWDCPQCLGRNYAERKTCFRRSCGTPRPVSPVASAAPSTHEAASPGKVEERARATSEESSDASGKFRAMRNARVAAEAEAPTVAPGTVIATQRSQAELDPTDSELEKHRATAKGGIRAARRWTCDQCDKWRDPRLANCPQCGSEEFTEFHEFREFHAAAASAKARGGRGGTRSDKKWRQRQNKRAKAQNAAAKTEQAGGMEAVAAKAKPTSSAKASGTKPTRELASLERPPSTAAAAPAATGANAEPLMGERARAWKPAAASPAATGANAEPLAGGRSIASSPAAVRHATQRGVVLQSVVPDRGPRQARSDTCSVSASPRRRRSRSWTSSRSPPRRPPHRIWGRSRRDKDRKAHKKESGKTRVKKRVRRRSASSPPLEQQPHRKQSKTDRGVATRADRYPALAAHLGAPASPPSHTSESYAETQSSRVAATPPASPRPAAARAVRQEAVLQVKSEASSKSVGATSRTVKESPKRETKVKSEPSSKSDGATTAATTPALPLPTAAAAAATATASSVWHTMQAVVTTFSNESATTPQLEALTQQMVMALALRDPEAATRVCQMTLAGLGK